jgi:hypothetical protein
MAQPIKHRNQVSGVQVDKSFRQRRYVTEDPQAIARGRAHKSQSQSYATILNPFQTKHMCFSHVLASIWSEFPELRFPESHFPVLGFPESHFPELRFLESIFPESRFTEFHFPE